MKLATLARLDALRTEKRPVARAVRLADAEERLLDAEGSTLLGPPAGEALAAAARRALRRDEALDVDVDGERWLLQPFNPPLRLVLVGAVHIAQALARMALLAGFEVILVDPREAFAQGGRFPGLKVSDLWPDEALEALALDARSAVVTLTHDPKLDDPALGVALRSPAFYIGCLGSSRTHASRLGRLERKGFGPEALGRVRGPVGLDIGARSPAEIAVSVLAEVIAVLRGEPT